METLFAENIFRLRISNKMTQTEVANQLEMTRPNYIKLEKGESQPKDATVQKIARLYKLNPENLFSTTPKFSSLRFRLKSIKTQRQFNQRESTIQLFSNDLSEYTKLEEILKQPTKYKPIERKIKTPKETAYILRKELGLEETEPIHDICGLLQKIGIRLILLNSPLKEFFGLSVKLSEDSIAIGLNKDEKISIERKIFTIAHELGHILLHSNSFLPEEKLEIDKEEKEADEFASHFLLPEKGFWKEWHKREGLSFIQKVLQIKRIFKVSYKTVLVRLNEQFSKSKGLNPFVIFNKNYKKPLSAHEEPEGLTEYDFAEENFPRLVREAFIKEEISFSKAAEILKISISEMRELANSWYMD